MHIQSEQLNELFAALSKAQGQIKGAVKDSINPAFRSNYADLESVWSVIRAPFSENGLSVIQYPQDNEKGEPALTTVLCHKSGQYMGGTISLSVILVDGDITMLSINGSLKEFRIADQLQNIKTTNTTNFQIAGGAITYMRRYALAAIAGVYQTDDDGNIDHQPQPKPQPRPQALPQKPKDFVPQYPASKPTTPIKAATTDDRPQAPFPIEDMIPMFDGSDIEQQEHKPYLIDFGKHQGRALDSFGKDEILNYVRSLQKEKPILPSSGKAYTLYKNLQAMYPQEDLSYAAYKPSYGYK